MVSRKTNSKFLLTYMADRQLNTKKDAAKYELPQEGFFLTQFPSLGIFIKDWPGKKVTILKSRLSMVKSSEMILFSYLHFTSVYGHKIIKEFLKNINFSKYDNSFSSEVSKLTSVRNKLNLPLKY